MATPRSAASLFLLLLFACGGEVTSADHIPDEGNRPTPGRALAFGGPLAHASADLRVLPGLPVRLDARGSLAGEEGLPIALRWTQEAGPRVALDDPTAWEPTFVAPPFRGGEGDRLVFLLTVDDGRQTSVDRVAVELVDAPSQLLPAPIALAGPDLAVRPGEEVELQAPFTLDPACLDEGSAPGCERLQLPTAWVQVEGPPVTLHERRFVAPDFPSVLTFRLDAHRRQDQERLADCAPGGAARPRAFCSAPDHVRVIVGAGANDRAPIAELDVPEGLDERGGLLHVGPGLDPSAYPEQLGLLASYSDPDRDYVIVRGFRPLLPGVPGGPLGRENQQLTLPLGSRDDGGRQALAEHAALGGPWQRTVAVAFQARAGRLRSAPVAAAIRWAPPEEGSAIPVAQGEAGPCPPTRCPREEGDRILLDGSGSTDPDTPEEELTFCWHQTLGPRVIFDQGAACLQGVPDRTFPTPPPAADGGPLQLAFALTVSDGGPLISVPDTALHQVVPPSDEPPVAVAAAPETAAEGESVLLDASGSFDPKGGPLAFVWRQIAPSRPEASLEPAPADCKEPAASAGACVRFTAPRVGSDRPLRFRVTATDPGGLAAEADVEVLVRDVINAPPQVDLGPDRVVSAGERVTLEASATDVDDGDEEALSFVWSVLEGAVELEAEGRTVHFDAPEVETRTTLRLELVATDPHGASGSAEVGIEVLPE